MPDSPKPEVNPVSGWEQFAIAEYQAISHAFSSGLNTMAVLLPLFFVFTGAVLNYVAGLFSDIAKPLAEAAAKNAVVPKLNHASDRIFPHRLPDFTNLFYQRYRRRIHCLVASLRFRIQGGGRKNAAKSQRN
jgi:hypothetical protein